MRILSANLHIDKEDTPTFTGPRDYNPTGWISIGYSATIIPPRNAKDAIAWLAKLEQVAHDLRDLLENTPQNDIAKSD